MRSGLFLPFFLFSLTKIALSQGGFRMVGDLNTNGEVGYISDTIKVFQGVLYFSMTQPGIGEELMKYDLATGDLESGGDLNPGPDNGDIGNYHIVDAHLIFNHRFGAEYKILITDGSKEGTEEIESEEGVGLIPLTANNELYFRTFYQGVELIVHSPSDGGEPQLVTFDEGPDPTTFRDFTPTKSGIFFMGRRESPNYSLFYLEAGSTEAKRLTPNDPSRFQYGESIHGLFAGDDVTYVIEGRNFEGKTIWKTDGTAENTVPILGSDEIKIGANSFHLLNNDLLFTQQGNRNTSVKIYRHESDDLWTTSPEISGAGIIHGDSAGHFVLSKLNGSPGFPTAKYLLVAFDPVNELRHEIPFDSSEILNFRGEVIPHPGGFFINSHGDPNSSFNPYPSQTFWVGSDFLPVKVPALHQRKWHLLEMSGENAILKMEDGSLQRFNTTDRSLTVIARPPVKTAATEPTQFVENGGRVFFSVNRGNSKDAVYATLKDGSQLETLVDGLDGVGKMVAHNEFVYFVTNELKLGSITPYQQSIWKSDGTKAGTHRVLEGADSPGPRDTLVSFNDRLYFSIQDVFGPRPGLFRLADDESSAVLVGGDDENQRFHYASNFTIFRDRLWFTAGGTAADSALWNLTDTEKITNVFESTQGEKRRFFQISEILTDGNTLAVVSAWLPSFYHEPRLFWITGESETFQVDPNTYVGAPRKILGNQVFFSTFRGTAATQPAFINLVTRQRHFLGEASDSQLGLQPQNFVKAGNTVFFSGFTPENGWELWGTDGTLHGTRMISSLRDGSASFFSLDKYPGYFGEQILNYKDGIIFPGYSTQYGPEAFYLDAATEEISPLSEFFPGTGGSLPQRLFLDAAGDYLFCTAETDSAGREVHSLRLSAETFQSWIVANAPIGSDELSLSGDFDQDGISNGLAYLVELPLQNGPLLRAKRGSGNVIHVEFPRQISRGDRKLVLKSTTDLSSDSWITIDLDPTETRIEIIPDAKQQFFRLESVRR